MSEANPFFGLAPARVLPHGQIAYQVREIYRGKLVSLLVTPYLPEALADLLLKARRPLNQPIHDGGPADHVTTRIIPRRGLHLQELRLETHQPDSFEPFSTTTLSAFEADGSQSTGLVRSIHAYQNPLYGITRQKLAQYLLQASDYHHDVAVSMACCAAAQPTHLLWQAWESAS